MSNALFPQRDFEGERRRALAKVYLLLLKLAEEAEDPPNARTNEKESAEGDSPVSEKTSVK